MRNLSTEIDSIKHYRPNFWWNLFDGGFFGMALGFASFMTIIPLFVSNLTGSAVLIGLIPAIHAVGWQFPQLFVARRVSAMRRYKPAVMFFTVHERLPFLGMAVVAWFLPQIGPKVALALTFLMLIWQGIGGGLTAPPWQSMIGKIIPSDRRGTFLGFQSSLMNIFSSVSAVLAGIILDKVGSPLDYTLCFLLACVALVISFICVGMTIESDSEPLVTGETQRQFLGNLVKILRRDRNFRWYLVVRIFSQLAVMAFAFYTVYAVRHHGMSPLQAGVMTAVLMGGQIIVNPLMGWLGDRRSHAVVMEVGAAAAMVSAMVAWMSPSLNWFYLVFILAGIANVGMWTIGMAIIMEFGTGADRPAYIGLANTLVAPVTFLAPILGGWLADRSGFTTTFLVSAVCALLTALVLHFMVKDPRHVAMERQEAGEFSEAEILPADTEGTEDV